MAPSIEYLVNELTQIVAKLLTRIEALERAVETLKKGG